MQKALYLKKNQIWTLECRPGIKSHLYELSGVSSGLKPSKKFTALTTCVQFLSRVDVHVVLKVC